PSCAGKGAQALRIRGGFCIFHRATGDMPREQVVKKTPLGPGVEAKMIIDAGRLVSDDIMVGMNRDQFENNKAYKNGCVYISPHPTLSSVPCTVPQAKKLDTMVTSRK
ncbi:adenylate kinase-domain-containing protein, partial [Lactifluus subvellereus]